MCLTYFFYLSIFSFRLTVQLNNFYGLSNKILLKMSNISNDERIKITDKMMKSKFKTINDMSFCITKIGSSYTEAEEDTNLIPGNDIISIFMLNKNYKYIYFKRFLDLLQINNISTNIHNIRKPFYDLQEREIYTMYHEYMVSQCITNGLRKQIPNFQLIYGAEKRIIISSVCNIKTTTEEKRYLLVERIFSHDYDKWINKCSYTQWLNILVQICLSLNIAYRSTSFIHNNLSFSNIILRKIDNYIQIPYIINIDQQNEIVYVTTDIIATITGYSDCYFQFENQEYFPDKYVKTINDSGPIHDIYRYITSSLYQAYENGRYDLLEKSRELMSYFYPLYNYTGHVNEVIYFIKDAHNNNYDLNKLPSFRSQDFSNNISSSSAFRSATGRSERESRSATGRSERESRSDTGRSERESMPSQTSSSMFRTFKGDPERENMSSQPTSNREFCPIEARPWLGRNSTRHEFTLDNFLLILFNKYQNDAENFLSYNIVNENRLYIYTNLFYTILLLREGFYLPLNIIKSQVIDINSKTHESYHIGEYQSLSNSHEQSTTYSLENIILNDPYIFCDILYRIIIQPSLYHKSNEDNYQRQPNSSVYNSDQKEYLKNFIKNNKDNILNYLRILYEDFHLSYDKYICIYQRIEPVLILTESPEQHRLNSVFLEQYLIFIRNILDLIDSINKLNTIRDCSILLVECCPIQDKKYRMEMEELYNSKIKDECEFVKELYIKIYNDKQYIEKVLNKIYKSGSYTENSKRQKTPNNQPYRDICIGNEVPIKDLHNSISRSKDQATLIATLLKTIYDIMPSIVLP